MNKLKARLGKKHLKLLYFAHGTCEINSCWRRLNDSCRIAADSLSAYCITAFDPASVTTITATGGTFPRSPSNLS